MAKEHRSEAAVTEAKKAHDATLKEKRTRDVGRTETNSGAKEHVARSPQKGSSTWGPKHSFPHFLEHEEEE